MPNVNFYLKKPNERGLSLIILQFKYSNQTLVHTFNQFINPKYWHADKQRIKNNQHTIDSGDYYLNDLLDTLEKLLQIAYKKESSSGIPPVAVLKKYLVDFFNRNIEAVAAVDGNKSVLYALIDRFIAGEIKFRGKDKAPGTLENYVSVKKHLQLFEKKKGYKIDFDTITLDFFYQYTSFLAHDRDIKLSKNTIAKDVQVLKVFMNEAVDLGYTSNMQFRHKKFTVTGEETDAVYLTQDEIIKLYHYDFSGSPRLDRVRDLFVFGSFVGLRFSDFSNIKPDNITTYKGEHFIKVITKKTGEKVIIPCNPIVLSIFKKYDSSPNKLPRSISSQTFNEYIKEVCKNAGLTETGRLTTDSGKALYECISSHTCRRSFATNYYLEGFPVIDLMKITGHRTETAFMKYIRITKQDVAVRMSEHNKKKNWSEILMRVA